MTRKITFTVLALTAMLNIYAQQAELLSSKAITDLLMQDSAEVASSYGKWDQYVKEHPMDENGWRNLYDISKRYEDFLSGNDYAKTKKKETSVLGRMEKAIPDSYTFNYCAYDGGYWVYTSDEPDDASTTDKPNYAERAIKMMPENAQGYEYEKLATYLISQHDTLRLANLLRRYYESGQFPQEQLQYDYNELQGMEHGGVYIAQHQGFIIGKLILQLVLGMHRDKILYCENIATYPDYLPAVFRQIGLSNDFLASGSEYRKEVRQEMQLAMIIRYICDQSKHPVYIGGSSFATLVLGHGVPDDMKENLYNEGLTLRYSATPYDNRKVKRHNVEERYQLDYLRFPFCVDRTNERRNYNHPASYLAFNYAILLYDLLPYYAEHKEERFWWLNSLLNNILEAKLQTDKDVLFNVGYTMFHIRELNDKGKHYQVVSMPIHTKRQENGNMLIYTSEADEKVIFQTEPDRQ